MAVTKYQNDLMLDDAFKWVQARYTRLNVCSTSPTSYAEATSTYMLAQSAELGSTDITLADGDAGGRKMTVAAQAGLSVATSGAAEHIALTGSSGSTLLLVTGCTTQQLTTGNTVDVPAWDDEIDDIA